jgi:ferredoxin
MPSTYHPLGVLAIVAWLVAASSTEAWTVSYRLQRSNRFDVMGHVSSSNPGLVSVSMSAGEGSDPTTGDGPDPTTTGDGRIDINEDNRLYRIRLPRAPGVEWGTDLSFSFVYVRELDPTGPAYMSGAVSKGDQLCELIPVAENAAPVNLLGASFDSVMGSFFMLDKSVSEVDLVFFRGTKDELKALCQGGDGQKKEKIVVTVVQDKGSETERVIKLEAAPGVNIRQLLVDNNINVYQSVTRWTNCKGKQLCGTCIVNIPEGLQNTNWKSMDEASTLRDNPESYRLSCIAFAYEDVTVETFPALKAYQWTR